MAALRSTTTKCTRDRGCSGHPAFPTPSEGGSFINASGAWRGEVANVCLAVIASEAKQSISPRKGRMDCFVASLLATTALHLNRRGCLNFDRVQRPAIHATSFRDESNRIGRA